MVKECVVSRRVGTYSLQLQWVSAGPAIVISRVNQEGNPNLLVIKLKCSSVEVLFLVVCVSSYCVRVVASARLPERLPAGFAFKLPLSGSHALSYSPLTVHYSRPRLHRCMAGWGVRVISSRHRLHHDRNVYQLFEYNTTCLMVPSRQVKLIKLCSSLLRHASLWFDLSLNRTVASRLRWRDAVVVLNRQV